MKEGKKTLTEKELKIVHEVLSNIILYSMHARKKLLVQTELSVMQCRRIVHAAKVLQGILPDE